MNKDGFDSVKWVKLNGKKLCNNVGHMGDNGIDKCLGLKELIKKIVLKEVGIGTKFPGDSRLNHNQRMHHQRMHRIDLE